MLRKWKTQEKKFSSSEFNWMLHLKCFKWSDIVCQVCIVSCTALTGNIKLSTDKVKAFQMETFKYH